MAMDISLISGIIQQQAPNLFVDGLTKRSTLYNLIPKRGPSDARGPRWQVKTTAASSAQPFAEGGTFPVADEFEVTQAALTWGSYVATLKITGQAMDQLNASSQFVPNYMAEQVREAVADLVDEIDEDLRGGATTNGITGITSAISDTGIYAGINRGTVTAFASYVNDVSGALSVAELVDAADTLVDTRGGRFNAILTSRSQLNNYTALTSGEGVGALRLNSSSSGQTMQQFIAGYGDANDPFMGAPTFRGVPLLAIPGYATDRMDLVDLSDMAIEVLRPLRVSEMYRKNDDYYWDLTTILQFRIANPRKTTASLQNLS